MREERGEERGEREEKKKGEILHEHFLKMRLYKVITRIEKKSK